jgi:hypothetical protein
MHNPKTTRPIVILLASLVVSILGFKCAIAQTEATVAQKVYTVSGIVRFQNNGHPISGVPVRIVRREDTYVVLPVDPATRGRTKPVYTGNTDKDGRWSVNGLANGSYVVEVKPERADGNQERFAIKKQMITVAGADQTDILIEVSKGATISGAVVLEGDDPPESVAISTMKLEVPFEMHQQASKAVRPNGQTTPFTLTEVPEGKIQMWVFVNTGLHYVRSITVNGVDLVRENLNLTEGAEIKNVIIVVSSELGELTGRVLSAKDNKPMPGLRIYTREVGNNTSRLVGGRQGGKTDVDGTFLLRPPPGEYVIDVHADPGPNGGMLSAPLTTPLQLTMKANEHKNIEIRVP